MHVPYPYSETTCPRLRDPASRPPLAAETSSRNLGHVILRSSVIPTPNLNCGFFRAVMAIKAAGEKRRADPAAAVNASSVRLSSRPLVLSERLNCRTILWS